ncbi:MAG TPA: hypothetical protein VHW43_01280, partial [Puia sp.]|nr:hypothetical protein [Puia sp.]
KGSAKDNLFHILDFYSCKARWPLLNPPVNREERATLLKYLNELLRSPHKKRHSAHLFSVSTLAGLPQ